MSGTELTFRLDAVGWAQKDEWRDFTSLIFEWMREATSEIARLQREVESLTRTLNARTEHLA